MPVLSHSYAHFQPLAGPAFLASVAGSGTGSYFADQRGQPFMPCGDYAGAIIANGGAAGGARTYQTDMDGYCTTRAAQGFNCSIVYALGSTQNAGPSDTGATWDGVLPFTSPGVLNDTYWTRTDYLLASAASSGITIMLDIAYSYDLGNASLASFTAAQMQDYGTALGNRYKTAPNLVWFIGGDYFGGDDTRLSSLLTGIRSAGDTHLITAENYAESTSRRDLSDNSVQAWGNGNAQFNFVYSYNVAYYGVEQGWAEASAIPVIHADGHFYHGSENQLSRNHYWWALSSGSRGFVYASEAVWPWGTGALASCTSETWYAARPGMICSAVAALPGWHLLVPDTSSQLVTAGRGTRASSYSSGGGGGEYSGTSDAYVTASRVADGSLALIYMSHGSTITVDESKMAGGYTATWIDPDSGATSPATPGTTYNSTAKGSNSAGNPDWALVLQAP